MKAFIRKGFAFFTIVSIAVYLLSCLTPFISPIVFWPMTFLALGFPILAAGILLLVLTWFFIKKKTSLLLMLIFLCGYANLRSTFAINLPSSFNYKKDSTTLRIVTWNVRNFDNSARHAEAPDAIRRQMINYLEKLNADVLMCQEFMEYDNPVLYSNTQTMDSLGYHYAYATRDFIMYPSYGKCVYGCVIFSKFPFLDTGKIAFNNLPVLESLAHADISFRGKRLRLFTTHLISMNLRKLEEKRTDAFFPKYDSAFSFQNSMYQKLIHYDSLHVRQAHQLAAVAAQSPYPVIISGDMNSVPNSYVYHTVKGNRIDAFAERGFGLGTTYSSISSTLRIDYIFADPSLKLTQFATPKLYLSDHFPVVADVSFN